MFQFPLEYKVESPDPKDTIDNWIRNIWKVASYEHNLLLTDHGGKLLYDELLHSPRVEECYSDYLQPATIYIKGFHSVAPYAFREHDLDKDGVPKRPKRRKQPIIVKLYSLKPKGWPGFWKVEVTVRNDFLDRHKLRRPDLWGTQIEIQRVLHDSLKREYRGVFDRAPEARKLLSERLRARQKDLAAEILNPVHSLTALADDYPELPDAMATAPDPAFHRTPQEELGIPPDDDGNPQPGYDQFDPECGISLLYAGRR